MAVTISQYIDAVQNPNGRFRTLTGIFPIPNESGEPRMHMNDICAGFDMVYRGEQVVLKCLHGANDKHRERLKGIATFSGLIDAGYITPYTYLEDEITVFDMAGKPHSHDILFHRKPEGDRMCDFIEKAAAGNDSISIAKFASALPALARWMWDNDFCAGSISARNITVTANSTPLLTDLTHAQRKRSVIDIRALCALEAALFCCACEPRLYKPFIEEHLTGRSKLITFAGILCELLEEEETSTLTGLLALLSTESPNYDEYVDYILDLADQLATEKPARIGSLSDMADALNNGQPTRPNITNAKGNTSKYTYIGELSCNMMRVFNGQTWCYLDYSGKVVIDGKFLDATDFEEGRAVVETADGYGMIDLKGDFAIPAIYDDIDWDSYNNIAIATKNGLSGIFSRAGEPVTDLIYDRILNCSEGLIPVKRNGTYGYIRKDGSTAIDFRYDDAFSFRDGVARVRRSGRELIIDTDGKEIDRIIK